MSLDTNKALVRIIFEEGVNVGDEAVIDRLFPDRLIVHGEEKEDGGRPSTRIQRFLTGVRATLPDLHVTIEVLVAENDCVASAETWRGTHARTRERVEGRVLHIFRFAEDQVVEEWTEGWEWWDRLDHVPADGSSGTPEASRLPT